MTGKDILEAEFEKSGMRGYRADEVDVFLQRIAAYVDEQESIKNDLTYKMQILADKIEEYKKDEESIREALLSAQKLGSSILNEAKAKAETLTKETKTAADEMLVQAKNRVDNLTRESMQKANLDISALRRETDMEQRKFEALKQEVSVFRATLLKQYKAHLDQITALPAVAPAPVEKPAEKPMEAIVPDNSVLPEQFDAEKANRPDIAFEKAIPAPAAAPSMRDSGFSSPQRSESAFSNADNDPLAMRAQAAKSDILADEGRAGIENEVREQTKEFGTGKKASYISAEKADTQPEEKSDYSFERRNSRPNYIEKFGELKFGGFGDEEKK